MYIDFSPLENDFVYGTCCALIFIRGTCSTGIVLTFFFNLVTCWFFFSWKLYIDFCNHKTSLEPVYVICYVVIFVRGTCYMLIFSSWKLYTVFLREKLILFMGLLVSWFLYVDFLEYWFLFVRIVAFWFFSSLKLYINFSSRETYFYY